MGTVTMPYPFTPEGLIQAWSSAPGPRTRLAIVDHISSETAIVLPCRESHGAGSATGRAVLADGAHAPAQIPVEMASPARRRLVYR